MKIRITEKGWSSYTGEYCDVPFENGVSTRDVSASEIRRMSCYVRLEEAEAGLSVGTGQDLINAKNIAASNVNFGRSSSAQASVVANAEAGDNANQSPEGDAETPASARVYTQAELAAIADAKGIQGLRDIADPMGVKGRSIRELIHEILLVQSKRVESNLTHEDDLSG